MPGLLAADRAAAVDSPMMASGGDRGLEQLAEVLQLELVRVQVVGLLEAVGIARHEIAGMDELRPEWREAGVQLMCQLQVELERALGVRP